MTPRSISEKFEVLKAQLFLTSRHSQAMSPQVIDGLRSETTEVYRIHAQCSAEGVPISRSGVLGWI
jgi:hypothetical protein